jgi:hypothetical protein
MHWREWGRKCHYSIVVIRHIFIVGRDCKVGSWIGVALLGLFSIYCIGYHGQGWVYAFSYNMRRAEISW